MKLEMKREMKQQTAGLKLGPLNINLIPGGGCELAAVGCGLRAAGLPPSLDNSSELELDLLCRGPRGNQRLTGNSVYYA